MDLNEFVDILDGEELNIDTASRIRENDEILATDMAGYIRDVLIPFADALDGESDDNVIDDFSEMDDDESGSDTGF